MRKIIIILALSLVVVGLAPAALGAKDGDTTFVQAFTFGSPQDSTFFFPTADKKWSKILMYYTLKCNDKQNPACGEWDYLTYTYLYRPSGMLDSTGSKDSTYDSTTMQWTVFTKWKVFEKQDRFEIARYITPYGINLSLGEGFTWLFDVTDYGMLLKDSVHLKAGNWQELLDMKFAFIEGTPHREPYKIENVWVGNFPYGTSTSIEENLNERDILMDKDAASVKLKVRVTGHGFGGNENCAEFCPKDHSLTVNGSEVWKKRVWRDDCAYNPVYPQGGTWVYQRANWCPGAEVETYNVELSPYVKGGEKAKLDYNVEAYTWNGQGSRPYYATETQLIYYRESAYRADAAVEAIISPSKADLYSRKNTICSHPQIIIKNYGTDTLTSLDIKYGEKDGGYLPIGYHWTGKLGYEQSEQVDLGAPVLPAPIKNTAFKVFEVEVHGPNGMTDENAVNNKAWSEFDIPKVLPNDFIVVFRSNNAPQQNSWTIKDNTGKVRYQRDNMEANKVYLDTVHLDNSCFLFHLKDEGENGLNFFASPGDGTGYVRLVTLENKALAVWKPDFGAEVWYQFNTGYNLSINDEKQPERLVVYPNPSATGKFTVDVSGLTLGQYQLQVVSLAGQSVWNKVVTHAGQPVQQIDLSQLPGGSYFIRVISPQGSFMAPVIKQ